jgi:DNA-directed RNA polymerase I subunit RPA43
MLSLLGSLQPDPFSPRHIVNQQPEKKDEDEESSASDEDDQDEATDAESGLEEEEEEEEDDSDMDTFQALGKRKDIEDAKEKSVPGKKRKHS